MFISVGMNMLFFSKSLVLLVRNLIDGNINKGIDDKDY